jgi:Cu(I)/Ag(I) efflux system periplasmic protein CusF
MRLHLGTISPPYGKGQRMIKARLSALALTFCTGLALAQAPVAGEVQKLDPANQRVTLKHAGIKHLDMPAMAMAFKVRDAKQLDGLAVGDRVRFVAEKVDGNYTITSIQKGGN